MPNFTTRPESVGHATRIACILIESVKGRPTCIVHATVGGLAVSKRCKGHELPRDGPRSGLCGNFLIPASDVAAVINDVDFLQTAVNFFSDLNILTAVFGYFLSARSQLAPRQLQRNLDGWTTQSDPAEFSAEPLNG